MSSIVFDVPPNLKSKLNYLPANKFTFVSGNDNRKFEIERD